MKSTEKNRLNILYLSDNNYAAFAGVSVTSLFINNKDIEELNVYLIDDNISDENKTLYQELGKKYGRKIIFLDLSEGVRKLEELGAPKYRNSYTTYLKLFTFALLPDDVHRIFFIDSDSVIVGSLKEMIDIDMQGCVIGAVRDGLCNGYKMALGYDRNDSWFNMGVMLVDVDAWKRNDCESMIVEQLKKRNAYVAVDQDLLNITQHGHIMTLDPRYNATPHHYVYDEEDFLKAFPQGGFYDIETMREAQKHAVIRHFERFVGESPWHKNSIHPYTKLFDKYLALSPWKGYEKKPANVGMVLKIEKLLYRILPKKLFLKVFSLGFGMFLSRTNNKFKNNMNIKNIS